MDNIEKDTFSFDIIYILMWLCFGLIVSIIVLLLSNEVGFGKLAVSKNIRALSAWLESPFSHQTKSLVKSLRSQLIFDQQVSSKSSLDTSHT